MRRLISLALAAWLGSASAGFAQSLFGDDTGVNTWAGNTSSDQSEEASACFGDATRFCGGNTIFIFEMENCLKRHLRQLSKPCRAQLTPTDFRKYHAAQQGFPGLPD